MRSIVGLLFTVALAGCLGPAPADDGPPYVVTVETRYVPDGAPNVSGPDRGGVNRFDAARLPNGTMATYPMHLNVRVTNAYEYQREKGREPGQARGGWVYDDACPRASNHAPRRVQDNECDGASMRSQFVLPPFYPQDRTENYSLDGIGWHGRGYRFRTANASADWNYTEDLSARVPLDRHGSIRLVFHHRMPVRVSLGGPGGEIPEWMDTEVIEPQNCTSEADAPYDYVKASFPTVSGIEGKAETAESEFGVRFLRLRGDAKVVMEWTAVCVRDNRQVQV